MYASVAAGGKFATEPWAGLFTDAYTGDVGPDIIIGAPGPNQDFSGRTKQSVALVPHMTIPQGATIGKNGQIILPAQPYSTVRPRTTPQNP